MHTSSDAQGKEHGMKRGGVSCLLSANSSFLPWTTHFVLMREIHGSAKFVAAARDLITQHQTKWNGNHERKIPLMATPPPSHLLHLH